MPESPELTNALRQVLTRCYGQAPSAQHVQQWADQVADGMSADKFLRWLAKSPSFTAASHIEAKFPAGHFYSPVVDPAQVRNYIARERLCRVEDVKGITFDLDAMEALWTANRDFITATPFPDHDDGVHRYSFRGGPYGYGDGIVLRMMVGCYRPRRVVEIGSGYSTACMLDSAEEVGLDDFRVTCIEPEPSRLRTIMRETDAERVRLLQQEVQNVDLAVFRELEANDILFIDSSHVVKSGSDVHYELFHIIPELKPGVLLHFHDCRWPFEYSDALIFNEKTSWNEAYAVRALLMYSAHFKVLFYNSLFALERPGIASDVSPTFMRNPGSAIWIQVNESLATE